MPIITLPIERLLDKGKVGIYANDRHLDEAVARAVDRVVGARPLKVAPFFRSGAWSFIIAPPNLNIAQPLPDSVAEALNTKEALLNATKMPVSQFCSVLRNALAHGGIAYLDANGRSTYDRPVEMFAFVSGKFDDDDVLTGLKILRVSEANYRTFLTEWSHWLKSAKIQADAA